MTPSFVTWQLRQLHDEIEQIDEQRDNVIELANPFASRHGPRAKEDHTSRRAMMDRMLRSLPKRFGFRDARAFSQAFARANNLQAAEATPRVRRRLTLEQIKELERRVLAHERPLHIARAIGCAEQTVLNRASQLRKRLADLSERDASGI